MAKAQKIFFTIFFSIALFICCSVLFSIQSYAYTQKVNLQTNQTVTIIDGENYTTKDFKNSLYFGNTKLDNHILSIHIGATEYADTDLIGKNFSLSELTASAIENNVDVSKSIDVKITFNALGKSVTGLETTTVKCDVLYNHVPNVYANTIYITNEQYQSHMLTEDFILSKVTIEDIDENIHTDAKAANTNTHIHSEVYGFSSAIFSEGNVTPVQVTVTDYSKTTSILVYISIGKGENIEKANSANYVRAISKDYFPYFKENVCFIGGKYYAKKDSGTLYFVDKNYDILKTEKGQKIPVDACLVSKVVTASDGLYEVVPLSKWVIDGNCSNMLIMALYRNEEDAFISSWTFDKDDIITIKGTLSDGVLDKNFYYNYLTNGYCVEGTKKINEYIKDTSKNECGDGVQWYVKDDTIYFTTEGLSGTYEMTDYAMPAEGQKTSAPWNTYKFNKVVFDNNIAKIGSYAFANCTNMTEPIELPQKCTSIGEGAFSGCVNMQGGLQTKSVKTIGNYAFKNCRGLTGKLSLGENSLNIIGTGAFYGCGFTNSLSIPIATSTIGDYAFANCDGFTGRLIFSENLNTIGNFAFYNCKNLDGDLNIPTSTYIVGNGAFANCTGFNGLLTLGKDLNIIGEYAFYNCKNLSSNNINLPDSLVFIGDCAFKDCINLKTTLNINKNLKHIGINAFKNCYNITNINNTNVNPNLIVCRKAFEIDGLVITSIANRKDQIFNQYNFMGDNRKIKEY